MDEQEDDIFDEDASEITIGSRDWKKMESNLIKLGYRDGLAEGQEINVQQGFNQGYNTAASLVYSVAVLRGEISAILSMKHIQEAVVDKSKEAELEQLLQDVRDLEQSCMKTSTSMGNQKDQSKDSIKSQKEDTKVVEASDDSDQKGCVDCVCKQQAPQDQDCGQVEGSGQGQSRGQGQIVQSEERGDISEHLLGMSPDRKRTLDELKRRLNVIMASANVS